MCIRIKSTSDRGRSRCGAKKVPHNSERGQLRFVLLTATALASVLQLGYVVIMREASERGRDPRRQKLNPKPQECVDGLEQRRELQGRETERLS